MTWGVKSRCWIFLIFIVIFILPSVSANSACTDSCESSSYKTDLPDGTCHRLGLYTEKGTTNSDEQGKKSTDYCKDSVTLREYYLYCDSYPSLCNWVPCMVDEVKYTDVNCQTTYGTGYICNDGKCVKGCISNSEKKCYSDDVYYYDSCGNKGDKYQDCTNGCEDGKCIECDLKHPNLCKHVGVMCMDSNYLCKDAFIYNNNYYCNIDQVKCGNGCKNNGCSRESYDCYDNDVYWYNSEGKVEDIKEECGSYGCSNKKCNSPPPPCSLTKAYWNKDRVKEGESVSLIVEGSNCDGKTVSFKLWEADCLHDNLLAVDCGDEEAKKQPVSITFKYGKAEINWNAEWEEVCVFGICLKSEYYFIATSDGKIIKSYDYDKDLEVEKASCSVTNTQYEKRCDGSAVYWYDNCGGRQSLVSDCSTNLCKDTNTLKENGKCIDSSSGAYCSYQEKNCGSGGWSCNGNKEEYKTVSCSNQGFNACWQSNTPSQSNDCGTYGCNSQTGRCNPPPGAVCGNNKREGNEECDGSDLDGKTCTSFNYDFGSLKCNNCQFDKSGCSYNEIPKEPEEVVCPNDGYNKYYCESDNNAYGDYVTWKIENNECIPETKKQLYEDCNSKNKYCVAGKCTESIIEKASLEDAPLSTKVYKKPGDYIILVINSRCDDFIAFDPGSFVIYGRAYSNGKLNLNKGENIIKIYIPEDTEKKEYEFKIADKNYKFEIIDDPRLLIITDRNALFERYNYNNNVYSVLEKAYYKANRERGIVYYLDQEDLEGRPFKTINEYNEEFTNPHNVDNTYSNAVSQFIKRKCGDKCDNVIILGDDFVVPHYRRSIFMNEGLSSEDEMNTIYSDYPYIVNTYEEISNLDEIMQMKFLLGGIGYPVIIVRPDSVSGELLDSINALKETVKSRWNINSNEISIQKSSSQSCNDFLSIPFNYNAERLNLILIGNEKNNRAIACLPFLDNDDETLTLDRNPFNKKGSSIIINSMDPEFINMISEMIDKKAYIYYNSPILVKISVKSEELVKDCSLVGVIPILDVVGDGCGIVNDCLFDRSWGWCGESTALAFLPVASSSHAKIIQKIQKIGAPGYKLLKKYGSDIVNIFDFGDFLRLSDSGSDAIIRMVSKLDNFGRVGKDVSRRLIQLVGYYGPDSQNIKHLEEISEFPGSRKLIENWGGALKNNLNLNPNALKGLEFQAEITSKIKNSNDVKRVINVETIGDVVYETKNGDIVGAEIKRHSAWGIKDISEAETQIDKLKIAIDNKQITKGKFLSAFDNVPKDIKDKIDLLKKQGYDITMEVVS